MTQLFISTNNQTINEHYQKRKKKIKYYCIRVQIASVVRQEKLSVQFFAVRSFR